VEEKSLNLFAALPSKGWVVGSKDSMNIFQPSLFETSAYSMYCLNNDCFYLNSLLSVSEAVWKETWSSEIEDLVLVPHCPSCQEVLWRERNG